MSPGFLLVPVHNDRRICCNLCRNEPNTKDLNQTACKDNPQLRAEVDALLRAHDAPQRILDAPNPGSSTTDEPTTEAAGTRIGPYKLLEQIGEGGMGIVWMAEQQEPVRRRVALKIIKARMDSVQVVARFEAERQALALMDHPHIAKVFDGGTTTTGRPSLQGKASFWSLPSSPTPQKGSGLLPRPRLRRCDNLLDRCADSLFHQPPLARAVTECYYPR